MGLYNERTAVLSDYVDLLRVSAQDRSLSRTLGMVVSAIIADGYQGTLKERLREFHEKVPRLVQFVRIFVEDARMYPDHQPGHGSLPSGVDIIALEGNVLYSASELDPVIVIEGEPAYNLMTGLTPDSYNRIIDVPRNLMIKAKNGWQINRKIARLCLVHGQYKVLPLEFIR